MLLNTCSRCIRHSFHLLTCIIWSLPYKKFSSLLDDSIVVYLDNFMSFGGNGCIPQASKNKWYKTKEGGCEYKIKLSLGDLSFAKISMRWCPSWKMWLMWVSSKSWRGDLQSEIKALQRWDESDGTSCDVKIVTTTFASSSM